jgi:dTDP-L-rhamnose 4-epimerase
VKVLVTGGAGFIGSHVVDALRARGDEVLVVDSLDPGVHHGPPVYLRADVDHQFADLRWWRPDDRVRDVNGVVHLAALGGVGRAAKEPENILTANAGGTARLVEVARGWPALRRVVLAGSFSVYGANYRYRDAVSGEVVGAARDAARLAAGDFEVRSTAGRVAEIVPADEQTPPDPLEWYGASKLMQELCWRGFDTAPVHVLRFSSVYGDRLRLDDGEATIIAKLAGWIRAGTRPTLFEDGRQIRDWVFVGDVVDAVLAALDGRCAHPVVNVCSGVPTTLLDACEVLARVMGRAVTPEVRGGFRPGDMRHCLGSTERLAALLGRAPVPFADGAARVWGPA